MEKKFIYPKNYFSHLNESKNQIYNNTFDNNLVLDRIKENMYNNNLNLNPKNQLFSQNDQKSYQLTLSLEQIKYLTQENLSLKKIHRLLPMLSLKTGSGYLPVFQLTSNHLLSAVS